MSISNTLKNQKKMLIDIEWKFITLSTIEDFENGSFYPKILLRLKYSDDTDKVIETDYGTFKKLQEEFEFAINSFNSRYSKKINAFVK